MSRRISVGLLLITGLALAFCSSQGAPPPVKNLPSPEQEQLLLEVAVPPLGLPGTDQSKPPSLDARNTDLKKYFSKDDPKTNFQNVVRKAHLTLWATTTATPPEPLVKQVAKMRGDLKRLQITPNLLNGRYPIVPMKAEAGLKEKIRRESVAIARLVAHLEEVLEELQTVADDLKTQPARWQANHALIRACLLLQLVHLEERAGSLGLMRKEFPPARKGDKFWKLVPTPNIRDLTGKRRLKLATQLLEELCREHAGAVWEQQAKHVKSTPLGTRWEAVP